MAPGHTQDDLLAIAARVLPGGVLGRHRFGDPHPNVPVHAEGVRLVTADGRTWIDFTCAGGTVLLGHRHPAVVAAIVDQAQRLEHAISMLNEPAILYAADLVAVLPIGGQVRFCASGSEATFYCARLARAVTGRVRVLKFDGAYHGHHDDAMWNYPAHGGDPVRAIPSTRGMGPAADDAILVAPHGDLAALDRVLDRHHAEIAAILVEPAQRMVAPPPGFLAGLRERTRAIGALLVFDETVTGFRVAVGGAQERWGVVPDLAAYGKSLGGGLPLAAVVGRPDLLAPTSPDAWPGPHGVYMSGTTCGNPLACAAGRAFLGEIRRDGVHRDFLARADAFKRALADLLAARDAAGRVVGEGPMWRVEFGTGTPADRARQLAFDRGLLAEGIWLRPGGGHYVSMALDAAAAEQTLAAADRVLRHL